MPTNFPTSLDSFANKVDGVDTVQAAHVNNLQDAVVAIETKLGNNSQQVNAPAGVNVPRSSGSTVYAIDASSLGASIVINNGATATPFGAGVLLRGLVSIWSAGDAVGALLYADTTGASIISDRAGIFATAAGTASKINVYVVSGALTVENKRGSSVALNVVGFRFA